MKKGEKMSDEQKDKIRIANTGKILSLETKNKISIIKKGKPSWNKGLVGIKTGALGETHYKWKGGLKNCIDCNTQIKNYKASRCVSCYKKTNPHKGDKNINWKDGISKINKTERQLFMETLPYKKWRNSVFERDKWTCVECKTKGGKLNVDHIKPYSLFPDLRLDIDNGRTLCVNCHNKIGWSLFKDKNPRKTKKIDNFI